MISFGLNIFKIYLVLILFWFSFSKIVQFGQLNLCSPQCCIEHPCPLSPDLGLLVNREIPVWGYASRSSFG